MGPFSLDLSPQPLLMLRCKYGLGCCDHPSRRNVLLQGQVCKFMMFIYLNPEVLSGVFSSCRSSTNFFSRVSFRFIQRSYPQSNTPQQSLITNFWPEAPVNIDAAYESQQLDSMLLFKGTGFVLFIYLNLRIPKNTIFKSTLYTSTCTY